MTMKNNRVATTVKVENALYDDFKVLGVRHKLTLQGLVEKTIFRYVDEETFRVEMNNFNLPIVLGAILTASYVSSSSLI